MALPRHLEKAGEVPELDARVEQLRRLRPSCRIGYDGSITQNFRRREIRAMIGRVVMGPWR
jgi:hypothetical protein